MAGLKIQAMVAAMNARTVGNQTTAEIHRNQSVRKALKALLTLENAL